MTFRSLCHHIVLRMSSRGAGRVTMPCNPSVSLAYECSNKNLNEPCNLIVQEILLWVETTQADCPVDGTLPVSVSEAKSLLDEQRRLQQQLDEKQKLVDDVRQQVDALTAEKETTVPGVQQLKAHLEQLGMAYRSDNFKCLWSG